VTVVAAKAPMNSGAEIPMTLTASFADGGYRMPSFWPVAYEDQRRRDVAYTEALCRIIAETDDRELKDILALCAIQVGWITRIFAAVAACSAAAEAQGYGVQDGQNIVDYLRGANSEIPVLANSRTYKPSVQTSTRLRAIARTFTFSTNPGRKIASLLRPTATAISHNPLMIAYAGQSEERVRFRHADSIIDAARRSASPASDDSHVETALAVFGDTVCETMAVPDAMSDRMRTAISANARPIVQQASKDLSALHQHRGLPDTVWCGTAGAYPVRAIALATRRRGGKVTGFDHGGTANMVEDKAFLELFEFGAKDENVVPTARAREIQEALYDPSGSMFGRPVRFKSGSGDPTFRKASQVPPRIVKKKPVILFVITVYGGLWMRLPPLQPDYIAVGIQKQAITILQTLNVEIRVRPHPETRLYGLPHPLADCASFDERPFRDALEDADLLIFDYPQTTTLWETACTDRPIVLIDSGIAKINRLAEDLVENRLQRVPVEWDTNNLPHVPEATLLSAVQEKLGRSADPSGFRALLAG